MTDEEGCEMKLLAEKQFNLFDFSYELGDIINHVFHDSMKIESLHEVNQEILDPDWG